MRLQPARRISALTRHLSSSGQDKCLIMLGCRFFHFSLYLLDPNGCDNILPLLHSTASSYEYILTEVRDNGVGVITLNRPKVGGSYYRAYMWM